MARMIPTIPEGFNGSYGEQQVFDALSKLPNEYVVFHSLNWNKKYPDKVVWGEADFTILHKKYGVLVIEVKSGGISFQNGRWFYILDNSELSPMKKEPLPQANKSKYRLIELIQDFIPYNRACRVEAAVWFPLISNYSTIGKMPNDYTHEIVLLEGDVLKPQEAIEKVFKYYNSEQYTNLNENAFNKIVDGLAPTFHAVRSLSSKVAEQKSVFLMLTKEQMGLLDYLEEQRTAAIHGSAGTGKTLLAVEKARRLSNEGRVLFLCFNKYLLEDLREKDDSENIDYYNLQSLTCSNLKKAEVTDEEVTYLLNHYDEYEWNYKHIIIDEGQDFNNTHIEMLASIAEICEGCFYIFYDRNQLVQKDNFPEWLLRSECRLTLHKNCRNTFSIADTSGRPLEIQPKVLNERNRGDMPTFQWFKDVEEMKKELAVLIGSYLKNGLTYRDICILTLKTEMKSILQGTHIGKHSIIKKRGENGVLFTTARKFKGLEAEAIIVIDIDDETMKDEESKRLFYVGASRARLFLNLAFVGDDEGLIRFANSVSGLERGSPMVKIAMGLNIKPGM